MPDTSERLGLSLPLSSETFTRETYRQNLLQIDEKAAAQSQADEPFYLKSAVYNSGLNQIDLIFGKGRTSFNGTIVNKTIESSYNISSPTINTDYYIYLQNDGSYLHNTTGTAVAGAVLLWKIQTGTTADQLTTTDLRDQLPGAAAKAVYDSLQQEVSDLAGTGRTTETVKGNVDALSTHSADTSNAHGINNIWYTVNTHLAVAAIIKYPTAGGTANALTVAQSGFTKTYGAKAWFKASADNTDAITINVNSTGTSDLRGIDGNSLAAGDIEQDNYYEIIWDNASGFFVLRPNTGAKGVLYKGIPTVYFIGLSGVYGDLLNITGEGTLESIEMVGFQNGGTSSYVYLTIDVDGANLITDMPVIKVYGHNTQINGTCLNLPLGIKYTSSIRVQAYAGGSSTFYATAFVRHGVTNKLFVPHSASIHVDNVPAPAVAGVWEDLLIVSGRGVIDSLTNANWRTDTGSAGNNSYLNIQLEIDGTLKDIFRFATHGSYNSNDCVMCSTCSPRFHFLTGFTIKGYKDTEYTGVMNVIYHKI